MAKWTVENQVELDEATKLVQRLTAARAQVERECLDSAVALLEKALPSFVNFIGDEFGSSSAQLSLELIARDISINQNMATTISTIQTCMQLFASDQQK